MKLCKVMLISLLAFLVVSSAATAGDFGWTRDFNNQARDDQSGFQAGIATRFKIGDVNVQAVLSNFDSPADAYIALRLGEISGRPIDFVIDGYKRNKGKGWGVLAKELGIKPGSEEFHALKGGHDLYGASIKGQDIGGDHGQGKGKEKGDDKGNGKGKGKGNK